ncbi:unnamed protein product, partial [Mesorhabditis belari]|uniref:Transcription factor n=1 Tax=Mesorhabditis belari TaxID=2138241 RepID=A0AAF3E9D4_9BILA
MLALSTQLPIPGEAAFPLNSMYKAPKSKMEEEQMRGYLQQLRQELGQRLCELAFPDPAAKPTKPEGANDFEYDGDCGDRDGFDFGFGDSRKGRGRVAIDRDGSKSLRFFSHRVCDKVKQKRQTTYNEVAEELVQEYFDSMPPQSADKQQHDVKNIRRRVYDALNVLIALNIVAKEKKTIHWVGPATEADEDLDDEMIDDDNEAIERKEARIRELLGELVGFKSLVEKNRNDEQKLGRPHEDAITYMPFVVIGTDKNTYVNCSISHDKSELLCDFNETYQVTEDQKVLEQLGHTYGVQTGVVEASNIMRVRSLVPKGLRHYLPSLPEGAADVQQGELQPFYAGFDY